MDCSYIYSILKQTEKVRPAGLITLLNFFSSGGSMSNQDDQNKSKATENKEYKFLKETIKKDKSRMKKWLRRGLITAAFAVGAGVIAAFVFVGVTPLAQKLLGKEEETSKVEIASDDENAQAETTSAPTPTPEPTPSDEPVQVEVVPAEVGLEDCRNIYDDMLAVADDAKRSLVEVIGISSQMDYFNQTYENQQQVTGMIAAENDGKLYILTQYRVVENVERIVVTFCDDSTADALFQSYDSNTGLAIIRIDTESLSEETLNAIDTAALGNSYMVDQGEPLIALGSPLGYSDSLAYGIATSVSNQVSVWDNVYTILTTDIIGSSEGSGVLVDLDGSVIGVIAPEYSTSDTNVVTALPISQIKDLIERLSNNEKQAFVGIRGQDVTETISERTGIPKGVLVSEIQDDSPAMLSGLKEYDVITKVGDQTVENMKQYSAALKNLTPGSEAVLTAMRIGVEGYVEVEFDITPGEI